MANDTTQNSVGEGVPGSGTGMTGSADQKPTIEKIYDAINDVLGGTNPNEMLCLTIPGVVLDKATYEYEVIKEKPIRVAANESRIANKMFDVTKVAGSDNGRLLTTQYQSALDILTPKLNSNLLNYKYQLRKVLESPASYAREDGTEFSGTMQQLFYMLYDEYVEEKRKWAEVQNAKKEELTRNYPSNTEEASAIRQEKFLEWYQTVAESNRLKIKVKRGKVLAIFSINDMKIIEGILDSGTGAEIDEAKENLEFAKRFDPDGGYVYPVTMQPADWFQSLDSSMDYIDLLKSSEFYAQQYKIAHRKRKNLLRKISMLETKDKSGEIADSIKVLRNCEKEFDAAEANISSNYVKNGSLCLTGLLDFIKKNQTPEEDAAEKAKLEKSAIGQQLDKEKLDDLIREMKETSELQTKYINASQNLANAAQEAIRNQSQDYTAILKDDYLQLSEIEEEIEQIKSNLNIALEKESNDTMDNKLFPDAFERRFLEVLINTSNEEVSKESSTHSSSSVSSFGVNFLFGGYQQKDSESTGDDRTEFKSYKMEISIGFLATKVSIVRNWFNPGVFMLTKDMYSSSSLMISDGSKRPETQNKCIFPCFPTAFVIAKDVTLKFSMSDSISSTVQKVMEKHASKGGGFLCFSGSSSSSVSARDSNSQDKSMSKEVTIKLPGAQVIGYYLQITPEDKSLKLSQNTSLNDSIMDLVNHFKEIKEEEI